MFLAAKMQNHIPHPWWHDLFWCRLQSCGSDGSWFQFRCHKCKKVYEVRPEKEKEYELIRVIVPGELTPPQEEKE